MKQYNKPVIEIIEIATENIAVDLSGNAGKGLHKDFSEEFGG